MRCRCRGVGAVCGVVLRSVAVVCCVFVMCCVRGGVGVGVWVLVCVCVGVCVLVWVLVRVVCGVRMIETRGSLSCQAPKCT